jgi:hypothetical protein
MTVKGCPGREATEELARNKEKLAARVQVGCVTVDRDRAGMATAGIDRIVTYCPRNWPSTFSAAVR